MPLRRLRWVGLGVGLLWLLWGLGGEERRVGQLDRPVVRLPSYMES